jgi:hypothetical protein
MLLVPDATVQCQGFFKQGLDASRIVIGQGTLAILGVFAEPPIE